MGKYEAHKMSGHMKERPFGGAALSDKGNRKKDDITKHGKVFEEVNGRK